MAARILFVEDDAALARALIRYLTRVGYEVVHAATCDEARQVTGTFDVGILDIELRDGYGFDLYDDLVGKRTVGSVIFFTGAVHPSLLEVAGRLAPCIQKTEGVDSLLRAVRAALANQPRRAAGAEDETPSPSTPRSRNDH